MTKQELIRLLNINLMTALRNRDNTNSDSYPEEYGIYSGQYAVYEDIIKMLSMVDIYSPSTDDLRCFTNHQ